MDSCEQDKASSALSQVKRQTFLSLNCSELKEVEKPPSTVPWSLNFFVGYEFCMLLLSLECSASSVPVAGRRSVQVEEGSANGRGREWGHVLNSPIVNKTEKHQENLKEYLRWQGLKGSHLRSPNLVTLAICHLCHLPFLRHQMSPSCRATSHKVWWVAFVNICNHSFNCEPKWNNIPHCKSVVVFPMGTYI